MLDDISVDAQSADLAQLAVFAAQRLGDGALTLLIINKTASTLTSDVGLSGFVPAGAGQVFRYSGANLRAIVPQADQLLNASGFSAQFPASSVTLVDIPTSSPPTRASLPAIHR